MKNMTLKEIAVACGGIYYGNIFDSCPAIDYELILARYRS